MSEIRLRGATSATLAAMNHIQEVKSRAPNAGTNLRKSILFAQRTINSFQGGPEHETITITTELLGTKIHVSSEKFHSLLMNDLVCFVD